MSAFSGVRVLDFSSHFAAAMAAMHLADFGAEVIKIDPTREDRGRDEPGWLAWNRNKTRLALDLADPAGLAAAKALIAGADVVIFDEGPGALENLGLDAATLTAAHPRLIHAWAPPFGVRGAWSDAPPAHILLAGLTGMAQRQASYAGSPVHLVTPQAYYGQANCLAAAIAAALFERAHSGRGQSVIVSGLHGALQVSAPALLRNAAPYVLWSKPLGGAPSYRLYQCADGRWLFLGALFEAFYLRALDALDVLTDVLLAPGIDGDLSNGLDGEGARVVMGILEEAFRTRPSAEWLQILQTADVPCAAVGARKDWFAGATIAANQMRIELEHPEFGNVAMPGISAKLSATPGAVRGLAKDISLEEIAPRAHAPAAQSPRAAPLAGIKVLDLGAVIAGPYAGTILAGFGADVVKIEPAGGDPFRSSTMSFCAYNRGKRGLALDLKKPEAKALFFDLVAQADVVLDNYRLGVRERLGIGYEALRAVNPRLISLSITGYGTEGPQAPLPGFDPLMQAQSGMMHAQGGAGDEPVFHQLAVNDVGTAAISAFAIIAALHARERTGEGQEIHTSLASQSALLQIGELTSHGAAPAPQAGARDCIGVCALERYYECADGWIAIACASPERYAALCAALGLKPDEAGWRAPRQGALAESIAAALRDRPRAATLDALLNAGAPAAPVLDGAETFTDAYLAENGFYESYDHPTFGTVKSAAGFAEFGAGAARFTRPAPLLGQHSAEILREYGVPESRIQALIDSGAVLQN